MARPAQAPAAAPSTSKDQVKLAAGRQGSVPTALTATDGLPVATADVTLDAKGRIVGADGRPYGGVELFYDGQQDQVLDSTSKPIDTQQIGSQPRRSQVAAALDASNGHLQGGVMLNENNQLVTPDGQPYLNRDLFYDPKHDRVRDAQGQTVDPQTLPGWVASRERTDADAHLVRGIRIGAAVGSGLAWAGVDAMWYRHSLTGMQGRVSSLQASTSAFAKGQSLTGRMAETPVVGALARAVNNRQTAKITKLDRRVTLLQSTPLQEARFRAQERVQSLQAASKAFKQGESLAGRMKDTPVIGSAVRAAESRRQGTIRQLRSDLRTDAVTPGIGTRVRNAVRGRVLPTLMLAVDGYAVYQNVQNWSTPGNTRKWDDALRIAGNGLSVAGDMMAFKRGDITNAIVTHVAGVAVTTVGHIANDQD
jgi:hypothetical protein